MKPVEEGSPEAKAIIAEVKASFGARTRGYKVDASSVSKRCPCSVCGADLVGSLYIAEGVCSRVACLQANRTRQAYYQGTVTL